MDFKQIKVILKKDFTGFKKVKVAILADSSTQYLTQAIRGIGYNRKLDIEVWEAEYDAIDLVISGYQLYDFKPDFTIIFLSVQKLRTKFYKSDSSQDFAESILAYLKNISSIISSNIKTNFLIINFPDILDPVFGNYSGKVISSFSYQQKKINLNLMHWAQSDTSISLIDLCGLHAMHGNANTIDARLYISSDSVFSLDFTINMANNIVQVIDTYTGRSKKCLILDLDNTLWGGIIGDDGLENIRIGDLGIGKAFTEIQLWAKALKDRGIVLAVCSKNDEANAREPFDKHPDMLLRAEDITVFVANWSNKHDNIKYIQSVLNIGFDSMVFIDDSSFERNMVRTYLPEVNVPELPDDPAEYLAFLNGLNLFETNAYTKEDKERTQLYKAEVLRNEAIKEYTSEADFLKSLDMVCEVEPFTSFTIPRVAQLTQRSNQFNLLTKRYTEEDVKRMTEDYAKYHTFSFALADKYGSHGLVGIIILEKKDDKIMFIDTWIMSCRVLKRGLEQFVLNEIMQFAKHHKFEKVIGEYIETKKNGMVRDHYKNLGFTPHGKLWYCNTMNYESKKCHIKKSDKL
ncbi:MAG TPA: HAD-IIIC family phosphatase [Bacteroidia bacterium]|jgi:FkbH-like protein|nr:HAD-IIIC family phosphatase [Bacteroidia bacterium]